ncbi:ClpXP protease specificity-enhancing factor [Hydrogenovibrio sp. 3SP14C1]|uniref:ClpXP protease specificity-enhancing factor n=1 Tax=Hydrogenovibrio sp. 3SP14C1 TaxID=3038774 RepID=UPI0024162D31|nr:ClpXP protease specificity-enhancing factor [Hydrogenovibrio sp. 3SP14C1]MDG4812306.1 ClpXP protease specificity-enhancing factor [Hydrogenovibrio sp. 3SP14C1]
MISNRPYMIRALFDWIVDNEWTPHLQVDANYPGIQVPMEFAQDGVIVLNVHPDAVRELQLANDWFFFKARFQGIEREIGFPPEAVLAIFARENGQGMPFPPEPYPEETSSMEDKPSLSAVDSTESSTPESDSESAKTDKPKKRSHLSVVK